MHNSTDILPTSLLFQLVVYCGQSHETRAEFGSRFLFIQNRFFWGGGGFSPNALQRGQKFFTGVCFLNELKKIKKIILITLMNEK
jgi:hypothetical protein